ncbi:MAG TPA: PEP-CTERM sorting domain-containing protein [Rhodocyclaceae bacterium]|nr:PEP-CTERM sorting domain-containing protein [Rhodocyclaceae bacterium]
MKLKSLFAVAALVLAPAFAAATPNLLTNGSFENPNIAPGTWTILGGIPGWTAAPGLGVEVRDQNTGTAYDGTQFVELDTTGNSWISQSVETVGGAHYILSFAYSPRIGVANTSNKIEVWWNGVKVGSANGSGVGLSDHMWQVYEFDLYGIFGPSQLKFSAAGNSDSLGGSLDDVRLLVPEPAMPALILAGLGLAGLVARRRKI